MTPRRRQQLITEAFRYWFTHGEFPDWRIEPWAGYQACADPRDRFGSIYFGLLERNRFVARFDMRRRLAHIVRSTSYRQLFVDYATNRGWKIHFVDRLDFPGDGERTITRPLGSTAIPPARLTNVTAGSRLIFSDEYNPQISPRGSNESLEIAPVSWVSTIGNRVYGVTGEGS